MEIKRIAIIDDSTAIRRAACAILEKADFEVVVAVNGYEGLSLIKEEAPDLAIVDVEMPKLDGIDLTHIVQSNPDIAIPIILLTSKSSIFDVESGTLAGANQY